MFKKYFIISNVDMDLEKWYPHLSTMEMRIGRDFLDSIVATLVKFTPLQ